MNYSRPDTCSLSVVYHLVCGTNNLDYRSVSTTNNLGSPLLNVEFLCTFYYQSIVVKASVYCSVFPINCLGNSFSIQFLLLTIREVHCLR